MSGSRSLSPADDSPTRCPCEQRAWRRERTPPSSLVTKRYLIPGHPARDAEGLGGSQQALTALPPATGQLQTFSTFSS
ncbi:unnamed protein product [Lampetra fluviatilis]